jgi:transposase
MQVIPGRTTDVADSRWVADLLRHGLLRARCIPPAAIRPLRELTRERKALVHERTQAANRLQQVLESANITLTAVVSDMLGASGRDMLAAIAAGEDDPATLAALARGVRRTKSAQLKQALDGRIQAPHRLLIHTSLQHITCLQGTIQTLAAELERQRAPFAAPMALLQTIPGVNWIAAATILAQIGVDMSCFPSAAHLASWAGVCPGNTQSGGKRRSGPTTDGTRWLRGLLGEVAWGANRKQGTSFGARYRRLARRHNKQKAVVAIRHHLVVVIYHVLRDGVAYRELGSDYYRPLDPARIARHHVQRLEQLGYAVTLAPQGAA